MVAYYRNRNGQANGDHEVHRQDCQYLPAPENRDYLGDFNSCQPAVAKARQKDPSADGCTTCSPACHTS